MKSDLPGVFGKCHQRTERNTEFFSSIPMEQVARGTCSCPETRWRSNFELFREGQESVTTVRSGRQIRKAFRSLVRCCSRNTMSEA